MMNMSLVRGVCQTCQGKAKLMETCSAEKWGDRSDFV